MNSTPVYVTLLLALGLVLGGCSSEDNEVTEHVWKDQVEAIDKAREVEGMIQDAATAQKKVSEDASY
jgi:hypothetical protein